jgi:hypothetical protein
LTWDSGHGLRPRHLEDLGPELGGRVRALDEPVSRQDWADVILRSRRFSFRLGTMRLPVAALCGAAALAAGVGGWLIARGPTPSGRVGAAAGGTRLVLYSKVAQAQFMNMADGRRRGETVRWLRGFNARLRVTNTSAGEPAAGDEATLRFSLYSSSRLTKRAGAGMLTCRYDSASDAVCDATFQLVNGRTLTATGLLDDGMAGYSLAVTGGNAIDSRDRGEIDAESAPNNVQKLSFSLVWGAGSRSLTT